MNILFPKAQLMTHKDPQFTQILFKQLESAEQRAPQKRSPSRLVAAQLKLSYFSYSIVFIRPEKKRSITQFPVLKFFLASHHKSHS